MKPDILIVDDEADIRNLIKGILEDEGYTVRVAANSAEAHKQIGAALPDLVVLDIWLQGSDQDGLQILEAVKAKNPLLPVLMISGHGTIETAVSAIKKGAYDFIEKPFKSDRLLLMIQRALETAELRRENQALKQRGERPAEMVGDSPQMLAVRNTLERVAPTNSRVMLTGEPGTGKDVAARVIHRLSKRADKPFLVINCATLRPERLEIELFGSIDGIMEEPGRAGVLEQANQGTLLLDEVADMPLETQGKILRVLQEQKFQKLGDTKPIEVDVRILASSNRNLEKEISEGNFRQDLYYRLNVVPVRIPPLRERTQDIPALVHYFSDILSRQSGLPALEFSQSALSLMQSCKWPGNIRQLRNVIEWALIMNGHIADGVILAEHLPPEIRGGQDVVSVAMTSGGLSTSLMDLSLREAREVFEREYLQSQVNRFGGNISKTAQFVGMERSALHRKLKSLQILSNDKFGGDEVPESKRRRA